jgi:hypothetical protein
MHRIPDPQHCHLVKPGQALTEGPEVGGKFVHVCSRKRHKTAERRFAHLKLEMELAGFSNTVTNVFLLIARPLQEETITSLLFFSITSMLRNWTRAKTVFPDPHSFVPPLIRLLNVSVPSDETGSKFRIHASEIFLK